MTREDSHRGSGRVTNGALARQWEPAPLPPHIANPDPIDIYPEPCQNGQLAQQQPQQAGQITPAQFVGGLERLNDAMHRNAAALQQHQNALARFQAEQSAALARYQQPPAHYPAPYNPPYQGHTPVQAWQQHQQMQPWQQHQPQYQPPVQAWRQHQQMQPWQQYQQAQPVWQPPNQQPIAFNPTISPHININIDAKSHSEQDNGGGGWWGLVLLGLFTIPLGAAMIGGR